MVAVCALLLTSYASRAAFGGLQFDGVDDYVTFGAAPALSLSNFTLEVWFKRTGTGVSVSTGGGGLSNAIPLIDKGRGEADGDNRDMNYILAIRASDNRLVADFEEGAVGASPGLNHPVAGITTITNDGWYHAAATYDGAEWRLYLNGVLETNLVVGQPVRSDSIQHAALATAMNSSGTPAGFFQGVLDEARIWSVVRSATEISNNFRRQIISAPGLIGRWGLDDAAGTVATNSGSSGIQGTLTNGAAWTSGYPFQPIISITNPPTDTTFTSPTNVLIEISASDDGVVTNVEVFANSTTLGSVTNEPFAFIWSNAPVGLHALTAIATDDTGLASTSAPVRVTVHDPVVRLTEPTNGAAFITPVDVTLVATVTPTNDAVTLLEFFADMNKLGESSAAPWSLVWSNATAGSYALVAVATETGGIMHTSAAVNISIATNIPPSVALTAPTNNADLRGPTNILLTATASDADGRVTNVEFFQGSIKIGEDAASPYTLIWSNVALGSYSLTAVANDNRGLATTSAVVNVIVSTNAPPSATITSPSDGDSFASATDITLTATATDDRGISKVEFFLNGEKFRTDTTAPYSVVWNNAALGIWRITAVATDTEGLTNVLDDDEGAFISITNSASTTNTLVSQGASWRYLDNGSDQGTAWRAPGFDDSSWAVGAAQLGYGDGDEITVVSYGPNSGNKYITTYFRRTFEVANPSAYAQLIFRLVRDDGAVVYLNNNEVFRSNMPTGAISYATLAATSVSGSAESTFFTSLVDATNLVAGDNILAVEIHQGDATSSDISFDLQLLASANTAGPNLTRGPYLQNATTNSVVVRWRTDVATDSRVNFGLESTNLDQSVSNATLTTEHSLTISNLSADTKYFYAIVAGTNTLVADTNFFFTTLPPIGMSKSTRLWVIGDCGTANANARAVRDAYLRFTSTNGPADISLMLGDNAYNSGLDTEYQAAVFDMYPTVLRNKVLWSTIGNHETDQQTSIANFPYLDIYTLPQNGEAGGLPSGTERYYSFDYADIHFVCLDAMTSSRATNGPMATWLRDDLAATTQRWIIAFWHHPPYSRGNHNSDLESHLIQMRQNMLPILESYGADLVLCGHSHAYERSYFLHGYYGLSGTLTAEMKVDAGDGREEGTGAYTKSSAVGTAYIVAGNAGQITGGSLDHPAMFLSLNELGSLVIDVNSNRLDVQMVGPTAVRDHYTIVKQPAPTPTFSRFAQQGFKARRTEFLQNGWIGLTNVGPSSTFGGTASLLNDWVLYSLVEGFTNSDTFSFGVTNSAGKSALGTATVTVAIDNSSSQNMTVDDLGDGSVRLRCSGIPNRTYSIQFSNDLENPVWQTLATGVADAQGVFEHIDTPPPSTIRYYRTAYP